MDPPWQLYANLPTSSPGLQMGCARLSSGKQARHAVRRPGRFAPMNAAFGELQNRLAEIQRPAEGAGRCSRWDQQTKMPQARRAGSGRAAGDDRAGSRTRTSPRPRSAACSTSSPRSRQSTAVRVDRGEPDPRRPTRLGEGAARPGRPEGGDGPFGVARAPGLGRGATHVRLLALPAAPGEEPRAAPALHRLLRRRLRGAVRRRCSTTSSAG